MNIPKGPLGIFDLLLLAGLAKRIQAMNQTQLLALARQIMMFAGGYLTTKGYLSAEQVTGITAVLTEIGGPLLTVVPMIWALFVHTKAATVRRAADIVPISATAQASAGISDPVLVPTSPKAPG